MPRRTSPLAVLALAGLVLCLGTTAGCSGADPVPDSAPPPAQAQADTLTMDEIRHLSMSADAKAQALPPEFPSQVPVIRGEMTRANAEMGVVFYTLDAEESPERTAEWYRRMYVIANWTLVSQRTFEDPGGPIRLLQFEKGDAKSSISISGYGEASVVRGTVTVGVVSSEV